MSEAPETKPDHAAPAGPDEDPPPGPSGEAAVDPASLADAAGKNLGVVRCPRCSSRVLSPGVGTLERLEGRSLPLPRQKKELGGETMAAELVRDFWRVGDVFDFDNAGVSRPVEGVKFLLCADCEVGPLGFQDPHTHVSYLALRRVSHDEPKQK